jgi:hypothetical protein
MLNAVLFCLTSDSKQWNFGAGSCVVMFSASTKLEALSHARERETSTNSEHSFSQRKNECSHPARAVTKLTGAHLSVHPLHNTRVNTFQNIANSGQVHKQTPAASPSVATHDTEILCINVHRQANVMTLCNSH